MSTAAEGVFAEFFEVNPVWGSLEWVKPTSKRVEEGDEAGFSVLDKKGNITRHVVRFGGTDFTAGEIAFCLHYNWMPEGKIVHLDGDPRNCKKENLHEIPTVKL